MAAKRGLYANIHAKRKRIAAGSGEKMRKVGSKGSPTAAAFKKSAKTAKPYKRKTKKKWLPPNTVRITSTQTNPQYNYYQNKN